jgi:transitional endoplasmic reticulum ATPase
MTNFSNMLPKGFSLNENYNVLFFIKKGSNAETYRVKGKDGKLYFLKLFNYAKLHRSAFDSENNLLEIEFTKIIKHPNVVTYKDSGELIFEGKKFGFLVLNFIAGETIAEKLSREKIESVYDLKQIISDVLNGLSYLHTLRDPIIHNEITPQNIMLDLSGDIPEAKIIDFGYARSFHQSSKTYNKEGLNLNYVASECFNSSYSPQSDLFSVGALMYHLLFGMPPWFKDISKFKSDRTKAEDLIIEERKKTLSFPKVSEDIVDFDETLLKILKRVLQHDPEDRFQSANEFNQALNGEIEIEDLDTVKKVKSDVKDEKKIKTQKAKGKGFNAIAGMKELKAQLQLDVIDALHKPEEYAKYGVTIPNGMLLYGPPGCGKTFFAKHFAEEIGFNFIHINPGTLKSQYVNGTEKNISKMFEDAEKNAPTIIFIDEISGLFPSRDSDAHEMSKNAVEAMLAEMDRTGEKGIFVLCATNHPDKIDTALLRSGRLDKKFYLAPPDFEARKLMFEMYLKYRPVDFGIDYEKLSNLTFNYYVSSDINLICDDAARQAIKAQTRITMIILEEVIRKTPPSLTKQELEKYEKIRRKMNGDRLDDEDESNENRTPIGFKP